MQDVFNQVLAWLNSVIWHPWVILVLLGVGIVFTILTRGVQYRALTHGLAVVFGRYSKKDDPGAISHFQALSAALSATVGVGNIGGTALAIATGGPGALFWMWIVGLLGMSLKMMEVTISMIYRRTDRGVVAGGPMWVADQGIKDIAPRWQNFAKIIAGTFCITLLIATFTGGLFFQAWNASNVTQQFFGVPAFRVGIILAVIVGMVILGGIKRIGIVASRIVPFMCAVYLFAGIYVLVTNASQIPGLFATIVESAFSANNAQGAFLGGAFGAAFTIGMRQAFFSNESGQGSSPIVHSAVKTDEPVREGIVAGLEPFIDTIVVCTLTGLVILVSGVWNREADFELAELPKVSQVDNQWELTNSSLPARKGSEWTTGDQVYCIAEVNNGNAAPILVQATGTIIDEAGVQTIDWRPINSDMEPRLTSHGVFESYAGASLTALAFDRSSVGLEQFKVGSWLVTIATWLFGISTMISWSYYGEQGIRYLTGERLIIIYRVVFCLAIIFSCSGIIQSRTELTHLANLGTGVMLWVNIPITLIFARQAIKRYNEYCRRMANES